MHNCQSSITDAESQRTYEAEHVKQYLQLTPVRQEDLLIKTFASAYNNLTL